MPHRNPARGAVLVVLGASPFILNAGVSRVALWARVVQKEDVRPRMWLGLALAVAGLGAATGITSGVAFDPVGIVAGLGAAACFAAHFLIGEHGVGALDPLRVIVWSFLVASVALNVVSPVTDFDTSLLGAEVTCSPGGRSTRLRCGCCSCGSSCSTRWCPSVWSLPRCGT